jgi:hypothetical protein
MSVSEPLSTTMIVETTAKIISILEPLCPEDRRTVVQAAATMLRLPGEDPQSKPIGNSTGVDLEQGSVTFPAAKTWMRQTSITPEELDQVFVLGDRPTIIATDPSNLTAKAKTVEAYVLQGILALLATGEPSFSDEAGREACKNYGCFDNTNHTKYLGGKGNLLSGSKRDGWRLSGPGLKRGAEIIKRLVKGD